MGSQVCVSTVFLLCFTWNCAVVWVLIRLFPPSAEMASGFRANWRVCVVLSRSPSPLLKMLGRWPLGDTQTTAGPKPLQQRRVALFLFLEGLSHWGLLQWAIGNWQWGGPIRWRRSACGACSARSVCSVCSVCTMCRVCTISGTTSTPGTHSASTTTTTRSRLLNCVHHDYFHQAQLSGHQTRLHSQSPTARPTHPRP